MQYVTSGRIALFLFSSKSRRLKTGRLTAYNIRVRNEFSPKIAIYSIQCAKERCAYGVLHNTRSRRFHCTQHTVFVLVRMAALAHRLFAIVLARACAMPNADVNRAAWLAHNEIFLYILPFALLSSSLESSLPMHHRKIKSNRAQNETKRK